MRFPWWVPLLLTLGPTIAREWFDDLKPQRKRRR